MPFESDYDDIDENKNRVAPKLNKPSIFDNRPKKPSKEDFESSVREIESNKRSYKQRAATLVMEFNKLLTQDTLPQNKTVFEIEHEKDLLTKMIELAVELNSDPNEMEQGGSINWITVLLKVCFYQRDKINLLSWKLESEIKKINDRLDKQNGSQ